MDNKLRNMNLELNSKSTSIIAISGALAVIVFSGVYSLNPSSGVPNQQSEDVEINTNPEYREEIMSLTDNEYYITQQNGTEPAFQNQYYDHDKPGIYVDVVSEEPLFSSKHKYDSGTGWPAFYKPLEPDNIIERKDYSGPGVRIEVASKDAKSHLGHVFEDGPDDKTGLRYCINSAALDFVPAEDLEEEGYGQYSSMFQNNNSSESGEEL